MRLDNSLISDNKVFAVLPVIGAPNGLPSINKRPLLAKLLRPCPIEAVLEFVYISVLESIHAEYS